jgi:NAD(P)-dependent dehydrogenase (short-subunit alcohol dehydrogenase family)
LARSPVTLGGKHIVITGGSQGVGYACALECARQGARVTVAARTEAPLQAARERIITESGHDGVYAEACDVADETDVDRLFERAAARRPIDGLIHAAAVITPIGSVLDVEPSAWWPTVTIDLLGFYLVTRAAARTMRERGGGRIVALSGGGASGPFPNFSAYAASKVAVVRLVESFAIELAPFGIEINALAPGFVVTRMHEETLAAGPGAAGPDFYRRTQEELARGGVSPEIGARAAAFLVSPEAAGISGKLVAAQWDDYEGWRDHLDELRNSDLFTLRRILPKERGLDWQ